MYPVILEQLQELGCAPPCGPPSRSDCHDALVSDGAFSSSSPAPKPSVDFNPSVVNLDSVPIKLFRSPEQDKRSLLPSLQGQVIDTGSIRRTLELGPVEPVVRRSLSTSDEPVDVDPGLHYPASVLWSRNQFGMAGSRSVDSAVKDIKLLVSVADPEEISRRYSAHDRDVAPIVPLRVSLPPVASRAVSSDADHAVMIPIRRR